MKIVRPFAIALALLALGSLAAQPVLGCFAMMSDENLVIQSDLIVWGQLSDRKGRGLVTTTKLTVKKLIKGTKQKGYKARVIG